MRYNGRMKRFPAALLVLLTLTTPARADGTAPFPRPAITWAPRQVWCLRAYTPITVDGRLDEAVWRKTDTTADFVDITGDSSRAPRFRTTAMMAWDERCLYVGASIEEPNVWATLTERDAVIFHDNDFEVFIDPDGDTHQYYELEINALNTVWDLLLVKPYRDGGPAVNAWDIKGLETAVHVYGTINDPGDVDRGWTVEMAIPWTSLCECANATCPPVMGTFWRVNFSRVEWRTETVDGKIVKRTDAGTGKPLAEDNWVWSPQGLVNMHYPEMWGVVHFVDDQNGRLVIDELADAAPPKISRMQWQLRRIYYAERDYYDAHGGYTDDLAVLGVEAPPQERRPYPWPPTLTASERQWMALLQSGTLFVSIDTEGRARAWTDESARGKMDDR